MKDVKLQSQLNDCEKSAIHAVKSLIFMEYPSLSKHIAFNEADEAYKLNSSDAEWIHIWLTSWIHIWLTVNKEDNNFTKPDLKQLGLNIRSNLDHINYNCESIFSWNIKRLTGHSHNLMSSKIEHNMEKLKNMSDNGNEFSEHR